jgi:ABC-type sugar transport system ATPase subunit
VPERPSNGAAPGGEARVSVQRLSKAPYFDDVSFTLARGEILGFAGLKGSGISELLKTLYGALKKDAGEVVVGGRRVSIKQPRDAIKSGIGMLTNDRQKEGLALTRAVEENITISSLDRLTNGLRAFRPAALGSTASSVARRLSIKTPSINQEVLNLSGGNQQKVVFAKWLLRNLDVVIADEPTRGVDVRAKDEIYQLLLDLRQDGKAMIVHSPEVPELLAICDRIVVVDSGRIVAEIDRRSPEFNESDILRIMHAAPAPIETSYSPR